MVLLLLVYTICIFALGMAAGMVYTLFTFVCTSFRDAWYMLTDTINRPIENFMISRRAKRIYKRELKSYLDAKHPTDLTN